MLVKAWSEYQFTKVPDAFRSGTTPPSQIVSLLEDGTVGVALIVKLTDEEALSQPFCELVT